MKLKAAVIAIKFILKLLPIRKCNYIHVIRQHYGLFFAKHVFQYGKHRLKMSKTKLDMDFLRTCKREKLTPKFVQFKIPSTHQHHRRVINNCYEQMTLNELKDKKSELSRLYRIKRNFKSLIYLDLNHLLICRIERIIDKMVLFKEKEIKKTHLKKLNRLRNKQQGTNRSIKSFLSPITNLSKRNLTDKEINILENGLNFVLPDNRFDEITFISNIETFFVNLLGHCSEKKEFEEKEDDEEITYNLTSVQLQAANKIRSICNNFRFNAEKIINQHKHETSQFNKVLKSLSKDKSIQITRPDKGKGIVIMEKDEYNNKMMEILNDKNTFKIVESDETLAQEDRLIRKLKQLKTDGFITEKEYKFCRPTGSQPARIYGLPKIHKVGKPLRPIVSSIGTFNYKLAKLLANKLDHLRKTDTIIKNTFTFVDELLSLKYNNSEIKMISFDISNLFTNVPLHRTIQIILDKLYGLEHTCTYSDKKRNDWCSKCKNRFEMKYLLEAATKGTNFIFNSKNYTQINGVAMGSPLGPLFADIYVNYLEEKLMSQLKNNGLVYWKRFVDDTFAIVKKDAKIDKIIDVLNSFDNCIKFTYEEEVNNSLPFLDIYITRLLTNNTANNSTDGCTNNSNNIAITDSTNIVNNKILRDFIDGSLNKSNTNQTFNLNIETSNKFNKKQPNNPTHISTNNTYFNTSSNLKITSFMNSVNSSKNMSSKNTRVNSNSISPNFQKNTSDNKSSIRQSTNLNSKLMNNSNKGARSYLTKNAHIISSNNFNDSLYNKTCASLRTSQNNKMSNKFTDNSNNKSPNFTNSNLNISSTYIPLKNDINESNNNLRFKRKTTTPNFTKSFATTIYRKPTYTGLITKWNSFVPYSYKVSTISNMVYRAIRICSSYKLLHEEFEFIEFIASLNGYPKGFIKSQIRKTLGRYFDKVNGTQLYTSKIKHKSNEENSLKKEQIFVDIPFFGKPTEIFGKRIINLAKSVNPLIQVQPIQRPPSSISKYFPTKDPIPKLLKSNVVYKINCSDCEATYIGKTIRQTYRRLQEHGANKIKEKEINSQPKRLTENSSNLRRSDRNKGKVTQYSQKTLKESAISEKKHNLTQSAVKQHESTNNHKMNWKNFNIIASDRKRYQLLVKESLLIDNFKPTLNKTTTSVPLIIFPEGLRTKKPKVKIKSTIDTQPRGEGSVL